MRLSELLAGLPAEIMGGDPEITGISYDSRLAGPGDLFFALPGVHTDGRNFIAEARRRGAAAVAAAGIQPDGGSVVNASDCAAVMAGAAARLYGYPDRSLLMIGVTGTNGKTTITYLLEHVLAQAGMKTGVIGTINYRFPGTVIPAPNTTPQSADVYSLLARMARAGCGAAVMEVSSHALALKRVAGIEFDIAIFTNLTRDHLDFHGDMEAYFAAKSMLFQGLGAGNKQRAKCATINVDDPWGSRLAGMSLAADVVSYGITQPAMVRAERVRLGPDGSSFILRAPAGSEPIDLPLLGTHNIYNALAAAAAALGAGVPLEVIARALADAPGVPGRLQIVPGKAPFTTVVDYAHTDDALVNVLRSLRELAPTRIITVFGCGGERDRSKRPVMGQAAAALSEFVLVTSDNPRGEDPAKILLDIESGIRRAGATNYEIIPDRAQAIARAVAMAGKNDIILIAGKGHEDYQIIGSVRHPFSDRDVAAEQIARRYQEHPL